jgi:hypothetical protein
MDYGMKISTPGNDVSTTDPTELSLSSKYGSLFVINKGKTTIDCTTPISTYFKGTKSISISNTNVYPLSWVYVRDVNGWLRKSDVELFTDQDDAGFGCYNKVEGSNLAITAMRDDSASGIDVYYYVFDKGISNTTTTGSTDYGFKVSKDGNNVLTADLENLTIHSSYLLPQIVLSGSGTLSCTTGDDSATITHSLGYSPTYLVYLQSPADSKWYSSQNYALNLFSKYQSFTYSNTTQLKIRMYRTADAATPTVNYKYFLFKDI